MGKWDVTPSTFGDSLFLPAPQTLLSELASEGMELGRKCPAVLWSIRDCRDRLIQEKRQLRVECAHRLARHTPALPGMEGETLGSADVSPLLSGRPRMSPETVLVFLIVSHHFQSVYTQEGATIQTVAMPDTSRPHMERHLVLSLTHTRSGPLKYLENSSWGNCDLMGFSW
jgi:hypothetical protein